MSIKRYIGDFPSGPVVKTPHFHCRGTGSILGWGTKIPQAVRPERKKKKYIKTNQNKQKST